MKVVKKIVEVVIVIFLPIAIIAPYPFPISEMIQTAESPDGNEKIKFYWKGSGLLGYFIKDNPWVYLEVTNKRTSKVEYYNIWADTPCDGVERLKNKVQWSIKDCEH